MKRTTWRALIADEMACHGETLADVERIVWGILPSEQGEDAAPAPPEPLDVEFDAGFGIPEGRYFTAWTDIRVYFPASYDGEEWCASVPRHPCFEPTEHIG